jgi:hypothetical protein
LRSGDTDHWGLRPGSGCEQMFGLAHTGATQKWGGPGGVCFWGCSMAVFPRARLPGCGRAAKEDTTTTSGEPSKVIPPWTRRRPPRAGCAGRDSCWRGFGAQIAQSHWSLCSFFRHDPWMERQEKRKARCSRALPGGASVRFPLCFPQKGGLKCKHC